MLKFLVPVLCMLGSISSCFSLDVPRNVELLGGVVLSPAMTYASCGNMHLLLRDYELALEDFRRAEACLNYLEEQCPVTEFMVLFGRTVAYDNLNEVDKCERALNALILSLSEQDALEEEEIEIEEEDEEELEWIEDAKDMYMRIALLAPSKHIQETLLLLLKDEE